MSDIACPAKHASYQPTDEEWKCPACGAGYPDLYIDTNDEDASDSCDRLHAHAEACCLKCHVEWSGEQLARQIAKRTNLVPCPCCKGKGHVSKEQAAEWEGKK